jgi:hypothetical protein
MTQQNMAKMVTTNYRFSNSLTLALNFAYLIIPHFLITFKLPILKVFFNVNIHLWF